MLPCHWAPKEVHYFFWSGLFFNLSFWPSQHHLAAFWRERPANFNLIWIERKSYNSSTYTFPNSLIMYNLICIYLPYARLDFFLRTVWHVSNPRMRRRKRSYSYENGILRCYNFLFYSTLTVLQVCFLRFGMKVSLQTHIKNIEIFVFPIKT